MTVLFVVMAKLSNNRFVTDVQKTCGRYTCTCLENKLFCIDLKSGKNRSTLCKCH